MGSALGLPKRRSKVQRNLLTMALDVVCALLWCYEHQGPVDEDLPMHEELVHNP